MFNGSRLSVARRRRGISKKVLARKIGVDPRAVSGWENGDYPPSPENEDALVNELGFSRAFFHQDDMEEPHVDAVSFRSMKRMKAHQRDATIAAGSIAYALSDWVERQFNLPNPDVPDLREDKPSAAAAILRQYWGLGERPVRNMVHLLEAKGVRVFSLSQDCVEVDAYSVWRETRPYVFLNTFKSAERSRFDAAHELGHLVLHRHASPSGQSAEVEANAFASAFLMPEANVRATAPAVATVNSLIRKKRKWNVSVAALAYRYHDLGIITDWHYRMLCIEIQKRGYRTSEPYGAMRERSQIWEKVFASLRAAGLGKADLARELIVPEQEITNLVFGLVTTAVSTSEVLPTPTRRGHLRLVAK